MRSEDIVLLSDKTGHPPTCRGEKKSGGQWGRKPASYPPACKGEKRTGDQVVQHGVLSPCVQG